MKILGIETSCDETAAAVVQDGTKVLSSVVSTSEEIHKKYGGIVPEQAAREQIKCIMPVIKEVMQKAKGKRQNIDTIAVTVGPGLIGSLLVGIETAKTLSLVWNKPIVPVNHLIAHIYANFIGDKTTMRQDNNATIFPALCLIVSGGHTELVLMKNHGKFKWIGGTRDDAAGECFDKCSRLLQLGYPGGPAIEKAASKITSSTINHHRTTSKAFDEVKPSSIKLPRPMINEDNFDFSFSGLKTALLYLLKKNRQPLTISHKSLIAHEVQEAITDVLVKKTFKAAEKYKVRSILIGGGVAANSRLREKFNGAMKQWGNRTMKPFIPDKKLCTDNATIIASTAFFNYKPTPWSKIKLYPSLEIK